MFVSRNLPDFHHMRFEASLPALVIGLAVIWGVKFALGSIVRWQGGLSRAYAMAVRFNLEILKLLGWVNYVRMVLS